MDPYIGATLAGGAMSGIGGYFAGKARQKEFDWQKQYLRERQARAGELLSPGAYSMQAYQSPMQSQQQSVLADYLAGGLSPAQQAILAEQRTQGEAGIARAAAGRGMPGGAQGLLAMQLAKGLGTQALQLGEQRQQFGMQAALPYEQLWERRFMLPQETELRRREQLAQY